MMSLARMAMGQGGWVSKYPDLICAPAESPAPPSPASSFRSSSPRSSAKSDPSSSTDTLFRQQGLHSTTNNYENSSSTRALVKTRMAPAANFSSMVKKFIETKSTYRFSRKPRKGFEKDPLKLTIAADLLAENLKKPTFGSGLAKKATSLGALHKKLFKTGKKDEEKSERKALTEVKGNTRTLAIVLRSERELLSLNKEQETQICKLE